METKILSPNKKNISLAAEIIKNGGLVAFPTETVYGLGANAFSHDAVKQIFAAKGRPSDNPLIVHLSSPLQIEQIAYPDPRAQIVIEKFMPGPLTIVLRKKEILDDLVTGGLNTVGVRIPAQKTALKLLSECGLPVAAPSANSSTKPSPTSAGHVYEDLSGKIPYILDGGRCKIGIESTIIDFSGEKIRLLRKGGIPLESLQKLLGEIEVVGSSEKPLSPGMKYLHYAPLAKVVLFENGDREGLINAFKTAQSNGKKIVILCLSDINIKGAKIMKNAGEYANRLFYEFRKADNENADLILCEKAGEEGIGRGVNSRLIKASGQK